MNLYYVYAQSEYTVAYIEQFKAIAIQEMKRTGIPASITLAQGILESNSGESALAKKSNNHFGIKCKSDWKGATVYQDDDAKQECFRAYPNAKASYIDHSDFLKNRPNYAPLFLLDPVDDSAWAFGLKKAGYATASDYPKKLLKVIDDYELSQYNFPELDNDEVEEKKDTLIIIKQPVTPIDTTYTKESIELSKPIGIQSASSVNSKAPTMNGIGSIKEDTVEKVIAPISKKETMAKQAIKKTIVYPSDKFRINQVPVIWATAGRSYLEIATQFNIALYKIFDYNEIEAADIIDEDKLVFLGPKKKMSHKTIHVVTAGETLYDISQTEGVQYRYLKIYNPSVKTKSLKEGDVILLFNKQPSSFIKK